MTMQKNQKQQNQLEIFEKEQLNDDILSNVQLQHNETIITIESLG
jgi:hypothetical protein